MPRRLAPIRPPAIKLGQEARRVAGVDQRVKSLLKRRKGIRVVMQVHLHAADINDAHPTGLQLPDMGNGCLSRWEIFALPLRICGPGPGGELASFGVSTAGFNPANGLQQAARHIGAALGLGNGSAA